jgi:CheY-like chemotaxis protein
VGKATVLRRPLILVAEDDEGFRTTLLSTLQLEGYEAMGVSSGEEALERIRSLERRPDLILLDLNMSVVNGWDFLAVRQRDPVLLLIPVIAMSAESEIPPSVSPELFLQKPFGLPRLREVVARVLEWSSPDAERVPRPSEPWSRDEQNPAVVKNAFGQAVSVVSSEREARRIVAAVNGTSRISTDALEQGIVDKGLECLYELNRYDTDEAFRREVDDRGLESLHRRRREIAEALEASGIGKGGGPRVH